MSGKSLKEVVMSAIYLQVNATIQAAASQMKEPKPLSAEEVRRTIETQFSPVSMERAWEYFCMRAGVSDS